ncbi:hypothetical protein HPP92_023443 [Vanilla planifolia]|uniref:Vacuolar iron transporter n=1 Tax=Vanilla planifolia TaxID=51239 RepID=A0A835PQC5_VANPL|nr:hypothetical protein HPP92_023443 [Vanilla planifolia]
MASEEGGCMGVAESSKKLLTHHKENHFTAGEIVRDIIIGVSDGLTVPFALAAGLSGADAPSSLILTAGLSEIAAGAISMGLGGYLAAKSEADHYVREYNREKDEIVTVPETEAAEVGEILAGYGLQPDEYGPVVLALRNNPQAWLDFMMKFELGMEKPEGKRAVESALTISLSYVFGGIVPLLPYMLIPASWKAMLTSIGVTLVALFFFGYVKGCFTGNRPLSSAFQTTLIGALASGAAYGIAMVARAL